MQNGNRSAPAQAPERIAFARTLKTLRNGTMNAIDQCYAEGHPELSAPFARILEVLASVDYAALAELDANPETGQR